MVVLVTCKNEEDPIKNEGARFFTKLYQIIYQYFRRSRADNSGVGVVYSQNLNSSKLLCMSLLPARIKMILMNGDLVYKFKKIIGNPNFSNLLKRIVNRFKRAGYSLDIMRQTACLVFNPIMVEDYAALFSCTAVVQASDSMTASM